MEPIRLTDRILATFVTAGSVSAAMALIGLDVLWLLEEPIPLSVRELVEWQIAPLMACALMACAAWSARRDRRCTRNRQGIKTP